MWGQLLGQIGGVHGVVQSVPNTPTLQLAMGQGFAGAVGIVRQQQRIACTQECLVDQGQSRQTTGGKHTMRPAL